MKVSTARRRTRSGNQSHAKDGKVLMGLVNLLICEFVQTPFAELSLHQVNAFVYFVKRTTGITMATKKDDSPNIKRSVSLSRKTYDDMIELCEELGVNAHSYMVNEIAKAIQRDRLSLMASKMQQESMDKFLEMIASSVVENQ